MDKVIERIRMEDLFILPFFIWSWNEETKNTDRKFVGWYAYTINERGMPLLPVPRGSAMGGMPHSYELFQTPEEAFGAAKTYREEQERKMMEGENGKQTINAG